LVLTFILGQVIIIHDVFGFAIPNTKLLVDFFASKGFLSPSQLSKLMAAIAI